ncbi:MAG: hypothetical protein ACD_42C00474G0002 [uncultured bacterium]|nr:MAG: hypothetical protein ACD_42C00474G0002 [uncultured bacterium]OGT32423.1 MAG: hypothetical protein A3C44_04175 [Gammaproteobacteria bacterium RIFCSPHIGHO2_02_FULL_39_13]
MSKYGKIYPVSFGFALGVISGLSWMITCWLGARFAWGLPLIQTMSSVYNHLAPTLIGGLWGFFWGFLHMFLFGILVVWIYNCCNCCFCPKESCDSTCSK